MSALQPRLSAIEQFLQREDDELLYRPDVALDELSGLEPRRLSVEEVARWFLPAGLAGELACWYRVPTQNEDMIDADQTAI